MDNSIEKHSPIDIRPDFFEMMSEKKNEMEEL